MSDTSEKAWGVLPAGGEGSGLSRARHGRRERARRTERLSTCERSRAVASVTARDGEGEERSRDAPLEISSLRRPRWFV